MPTQPQPHYTNEDSQVPNPARTHQEPTFTEAPAICFTQLYGQKDGQIVQFNLTIRANTGPDVIDQLLDAIQYAKRFGLSTIRPDVSQPGPAPKAPATQTPATAPIVQPATAGMPTPATPAPAPINTPVTAATGSDPTHRLHAVKLNIIPQADGKVKLEWFELDHQYPDITSTRTVEKAAEILANTGTWTGEYFTKMGTYNVHHRITWQPSAKMNSKGNPYKDIILVESY